MLNIISLYLRVIITLNTLMFINIHVPSESMENTIYKDSYILCNRYNNDKKIERYDIVIFKSPMDKNELYIKRVIGLPGEHIEIKKGKIYINNTEIVETYLKEEWILDNDGYVFDIPEDRYLMLGDNRNNSNDTRYWKKNEHGKENYVFASNQDIMAKVWIQYYPEIKKLN